MRALTLSLVPLLLSCASVFAAGTNPGTTDPEQPGAEPAMIPRLPQFVGTGGVSTANPYGYNALFGNPAGFSGPNGSVTIVSASGWLDAQPERSIPAIYDSVRSSGASLRSLGTALLPELSTTGFGYGSQVGIGLVGHGLALALTGVAKGWFYGSSPSDLSGDLMAEITLLGGISVPFSLFGIDFSVGADARPLARIHAPLDAASSLRVLDGLQGGDLTLRLFNGVPTLNGYGLGIDAGLLARAGAFAFGVSVRDIAGTQLNYALHRFETVTEYLGQGGLPPTSSSLGGDLLSVSYSVPMTVNLGLSFHPDLGATSRVFDPVVSVELPDSVPVFAGSRDVLPSLRASVDIGLFSIIHVYGGAAVNYVSAGIGLKLLFLDLTVAAGMRTVPTATSAPESGISAEFAIRF